MELNKIYYYVICLFAVFIFLWGAVDLASSGATLLALRPASERPAEEIEGYYQRRVAADRLIDALARIVISGAVFIYCRKKA